MACTRAYADVPASARKAGSGIEAADAVIAAIALDSGFSVATKDVSPFLAAGVKVINPWEDQGPYLCPRAGEPQGKLVEVWVEEDRKSELHATSTQLAP